MCIKNKYDKQIDFFPFTSRFTFSMVMRDQKICKGMLERILPDVDFGDVRINEGESEDEFLQRMKDFMLRIETEKALDLDPTAHGVRFDALVKSTNTWAEFEMQTYTGEHIGKRSRYYQSNVDMEAFSRGEAYTMLPPTYIIFICTFDYMKQGKPVYFFQHYDVKNNLPLDDEAYIIILNTKCNPELVPDSLKSLFAYINDPTEIEDEFIQLLDERVQQYNNREWRGIQVTFEQFLQDSNRQAREQALAEGREQGLAEGRERGLAEGREEGRAMMTLEIAKNMLDQGISIDVITKSTGLTLEEVQKLKG